MQILPIVNKENIKVSRGRNRKEEMSWNRLIYWRRYLIINYELTFVDILVFNCKVNPWLAPDVYQIIDLFLILYNLYFLIIGR